MVSRFRHKFVRRDSTNFVEPCLVVSLEAAVNRYLNTGEMLDTSSIPDSFDFEDSSKVDLDGNFDFGGSRIEAVMESKHISSINKNSSAPSEPSPAPDSSGEASHKSAEASSPEPSGEQKE